MARKTKKLKTKEKIAIVGEGQTEWFYFNGMRRAESFEFDLKPELPKHSDLTSIFNKAKELIGKGYDKVFCVVDYDVVVASNKTLQLFNSLIKTNPRIVFVENMPCLEYWFLLHFLSTYSSRIYMDFDALKSDLTSHIPGYEKSKKFLEKNDLYKILKKNDMQKNAIKLSIKSEEKKISSQNKHYPYSKMHVLLKGLKLTS